MRLWRPLRIYNHLRHSVTVAQVDEDQSAVIPCPVDPPLQGRRMSGLRWTKLATGVCALHEGKSVAPGGCEVGIIPLRSTLTSIGGVDAVDVQPAAT
jgi:hypothetical protein